MKQGFQMNRCHLAIAIVLLLLAGDGQAQPSDWKVGFAARDITPGEPVFLAGYASRNRPFQGVAAKLWVKAMALEDTNGKRAVLLTSDLIGFRRGVGEQIRARLQEQTGLDASEIVLIGSALHDLR